MILLALYLAASVAWLVVSLSLGWRQVRSRRRAADDLPELDAYEHAYLSGGPDGVDQVLRAVTNADGPVLADDDSPLLAGGRSPELIEERLIAHGLLEDLSARRWTSWCGWILMAGGGLWSVARMIGGTGGEIDDIAATLLLASCVLFFLVTVIDPVIPAGAVATTPAGERVLARARSRRPLFAPMVSPDDVRTAVALYGPRALEGRAPARAPSEPAPVAGVAVAGVQPPRPVLAGADGELLLAEELALVCHGASGVEWLGGSFAACLVGACVADLAVDGRIVVEWSPALEEPAIRLVDPSPTGDELLDDVLAALAAPVAPSRTGARASLPWGARRRIQSRGRVGTEDLPAWWNGQWSIAEFPDAAHTLLAALLSVLECLSPVMERVNDRLSDRGLMIPDRLGGRRAEHGDRWCHGFVEERILAGVHEGWRWDAARSGHGASSRAGYLAALEQPWLQGERDRAEVAAVAVSRPDRMLADAVNTMSLAWFVRTVG